MFVCNMCGERWQYYCQNVRILTCVVSIDSITVRVSEYQRVVSVDSITVRVSEYQRVVSVDSITVRVSEYQHVWSALTVLLSEY